MTIMADVVEIADNDETLVCLGCGKVIPIEDDFDTYWDQGRDDHSIADSGNYCDDCFPRCYHPNCQ